MLQLQILVLLVYLQAEHALSTDDFGAEVAGSPRWIRRQLVVFVLSVCRAVTADGIEISAKKSSVLASGAAIGRLLQSDLT